MGMSQSLLIPRSSPQLLSLTHNGIDRAETADITVSGRSFRPTDVVSLGAGVTVNDTTFVNSRKLTVNVTAADTATCGLRTATITRDKLSRTLSNSLMVFRAIDAVENIVYDYTTAANGGVFAPTLIGTTWHGFAQNALLDGLHHFTSPDSVTWTLAASNAIPATPGYNYMIHPSVIKIGAEYWIYFSQQDGDEIHSIWRATTADWVTFTKDASPVITKALNGGQPPAGYNCPGVYKAGSTYYIACSAVQPVTGIPDMALFSSADGVAWTYLGLALSRVSTDWDYALGRLDPHVIVNADGLYEMSYVVYNPVTAIQNKSTALSADGATWFKRGAVESIDTPDSIGDVHLVEEDENYRRLIWSQRNGASWGIGTGTIGTPMATLSSDDPTNDSVTTAATYWADEDGTYVQFE